MTNVPAMFFAKVGAAVFLDRKRLVRRPFLLDNNTMCYSFDEDEWNTDFGRSQFERINLTSLVQVGALPSYNACDVEGIEIRLPDNLEEQHKIGALFRNLDSLITLHQRKYDKLRTMKKSMLDKMFPKPGEFFPEIRFEGFTDPWEQCKLGEVAEIVGGGTPSTSIEEYWDGEINWYAPAELGEQRYADSSLRKITQAGYDNSSAKMLPANKTILFTSRAGIGNTAILRRSACTNQGFQSLVINDSADVDFVYSLSDEIKRKAEIMASGSTFLEISGKQLAEIDIQIPHLDEQRQIGAVFRSLDSLITLHQRKLELLKNVKKSLLDKMFV